MTPRVPEGPESGQTHPDTGSATVIGMHSHRRRQPMSSVTSCVLVDLTRAAPDRQRHEMVGLDQLPLQSWVRLVVGDRWPEYFTIADLAEAAAKRSLRIDVEGSMDRAPQWATWLREAIAIAERMAVGETR
jgi:hypothetical protein